MSGKVRGILEAYFEDFFAIAHPFLDALLVFFILSFPFTFSWGENNPSTEKSQLLSDHWYTITLQKKIHYGYYNDRIELKNGKLFYQNKAWKKEEGYLNEEHLGAFSENNADLTPLFFNFHSTYRLTETFIDGTVRESQQLTVRVRKGGQELPVIKRSIPRKTIFSVFFPYWLKLRMTSIQPGQSLTFYTVLEDHLQQEFSPVSGRVSLEKPDEFAKLKQAKKFSVYYRDQKSLWWADFSGTTLLIEIPQQKMLIEKVSEQKARQFLKE